MNCKPRDMAVVVHGDNVGLIVEIVCVSEYYGPPYWQVRSPWPVRATNPDGTVVRTKIGSIHDARMRPIRPDDEHLVEAALKEAVTTEV